MPNKFQKIVQGRSLYQRAVRLLAAGDCWFEAHPSGGDDDQFLLVVGSEHARVLTRIVAEAEKAPDDPPAVKVSPFAAPPPEPDEGEFAKLFGRGRDQVVVILEANCDDGGSGILFWFDPKHEMLAPSKVTIGYNDPAKSDEENYDKAEAAFRKTTEADANMVAANSRASMHKMLAEAEEAADAKESGKP